MATSSSPREGFSLLPNAKASFCPLTRAQQHEQGPEVPWAAPRLEQSPHTATSTTSPGWALWARGFPTPPTPYAHMGLLWTRFTQSQDFCGVGTGGSQRCLHSSPNVYLEPPVSHLRCDSSTGFCTKNGHGSRMGEEREHIFC